MHFTTVHALLDLTINPPAFQGQTPDIFIQFMASLQGMPLMIRRNGRRYRVKRHGNRAPHKHSLQYGWCGGGINDVRNVWRVYAVGCCVSHHLCALLLACSRLWHWRSLVVHSLQLKCLADTDHALRCGENCSLSSASVWAPPISKKTCLAGIVCCTGASSALP